MHDSQQRYCTGGEFLYLLNTSLDRDGDRLRLRETANEDEPLQAYIDAVNKPVLKWTVPMGLVFQYPSAVAEKHQDKGFAIPFGMVLRPDKTYANRVDYWLERYPRVHRILVFPASLEEFPYGFSDIVKTTWPEIDWVILSAEVLKRHGSDSTFEGDSPHGLRLLATCLIEEKILEFRR